jgi:hypothetical protein
MRIAFPATSTLLIAAVLSCTGDPSRADRQASLQLPEASTASQKTAPLEPTQDPETTPRARLRLSGQLEGYLEPCGCASAQLGGLARRSFTNQQDRAYDLLIEGGNFSVGGTDLDLFKLMTILQVLSNKESPYKALGIGPRDLQLDPEILGEYLSLFEVPSIASDLRPKLDQTWTVKSHVEYQLPGSRVRIASLALRAPEDAYELLPAGEAWQNAMAGVAEDCFRVLLVHGSKDEARAQASLEPRPDLIVSIGASHAEPPSAADDVDGIPIVFPGIHGRYLLDVTIARVDGRSQLRRYRPIQLAGSRTAKGAMEDKDMRAVIRQHRFDVKEAGIREVIAESKPRRSESEYIGSAACAGCHPAASKAWSESKHAHAWQTLVDAEVSGRYDWPVTFYPDCIACHTVAYGEEGGFVNPEKTPTLLNVGCEQCHGPALDHVTSRGKTVLGPVEPISCTSCHDMEQSPDFDYSTMWKMIEHGLK